MKALLVALCLISAQSFAGDGGFSNYTCTSASGRTLLNFFVDNYSGSKIPQTVRLTIDGQQVEYKPEIDANGEVVGCEDDCTNIHFDYKRKMLTVNEGESILLEAFLDGNRSSISKGFFDPRTNTGFVSKLTTGIKLTCKYFFQGP